MRSEVAVHVLNAEYAGGAIEVALVNNMPDQAVEATRAQFMRVAQAGASDIEIRFRSYLLPSVARSDTAKRHLAQTHDDIAALYARGADVLIVTGAEPKAATLKDEPYWDEFGRLVDWAREHTLSCLWSCLAAHMAVLHLDSIARRREERKISGIFALETLPEDWSTQTAPASILAPHSRYNSLCKDDLVAKGYVVSAWSEAIGPDTFWRREPSLFLFTQGHPEYDADTLAKEYRRDVLRYLNGERSNYPDAPTSYFSPGALERFDALKDRALRDGADGCEEVLAGILSSEQLHARWAQHATRLYANWLTLVAQEKSARSKAG